MQRLLASVPPPSQVMDFAMFCPCPIFVVLLMAFFEKVGRVAKF